MHIITVYHHCNASVRAAAQTVPGVYGVAPGSYSDAAMNSADPVAAKAWTAVDGGAWCAHSAPRPVPPP